MLHVLVELAGGNESAVSRQSAWQRLAVEGLATFLHPDTEANRDGLAVDAAPTLSAWLAALEVLIRLLREGLGVTGACSPHRSGPGRLTNLG